ncbi:TPA: serine protease [Staphylococcus aureus]|uniref:trypsin-like serine peptidase n=1 Tax=Staphylococcus aureus TaxID=1280 RepID=UPI00030A5F08|nr:trypsin-like peptidase domain-containing protein [Staphylococcus aureus]MBI0976361.1 serine protease [Staphylococcus aureus]MBU9754565.1 trypsin-like serine protease [Staphylococcus aureus]MBU9759458.1 trypsin-like serine protease [Staphylococcus aureus]MBU9780275.1 trypsin-like serine protease [Staphylococcus aureus]MBU9787740.1 trypsin-like serine protease [Staphylococcus aureus]
MNKNIIIKSIAVLTILTSITGVGTTVVEGIQQTDKAEHNVTKITNTSISPYKGILRVGAGTGFVVGKNTILTNRHVAKDVQVGSTVLAHPNGENDTGGYYKVKKVIPYTGSADLAIVQVEEDSVYPKNKKFGENTEILTLTSEVKANERIAIVGYPAPYKNKHHMYQSTGTVLSINGDKLVSDAFAEGGNSGSPVFNSNHEVIAIAYAVDVKNDATKKSYLVYFTSEIKKFIADNTDK